MANEDDPRVRAVAKVPKPPQQRGVAKVSSQPGEKTGRLYPSVPDPRPVFVDDSGRRRRWLTWLSIAFVLLGLALVAAFWWSQASSTGA
jgi:hypothetical protein